MRDGTLEKGDRRLVPMDSINNVIEGRDRVGSWNCLVRVVDSFGFKEPWSITYATIQGVDEVEGAS